MLIEPYKSEKPYLLKHVLHMPLKDLGVQTTYLKELVKYEYRKTNFSELSVKFVFIVHLQWLHIPPLDVSFENKSSGLELE